MKGHTEGIKVNGRRPEDCLQMQSFGESGSGSLEVSNERTRDKIPVYVRPVCVRLDFRKLVVNDISIEK